MFEGQQDEIDRRLLYLSNSSNSDEVVERLEEGVKKLRHLDIATGYLELLTEVDNLRYDGNIRARRMVGC